VLSLDADEEVSEELKSEILSIQLKDLKGFFIPRLTFYMNQWIKYGGWYPNYQLRFFHKNSGKFSGHLVHETVEVEGRIEYLKNPLKHYSYKNISDHLQFIDKYSELHAFEKYRKGKKSGVTIAILEAIWKFLSMYFLRFGFLDGKVGLIIAILGSYYNFLKYIKVYELNSQSNKKKTLIEVEKVTPIEILKES
jgi:hypothetical protein